MSSLLILGGGHSEIPLIKASKELGFYVITTGYNRDGLGHKYSDEYIYADFSNKDEILNIVKERKIDFIVPSCNDFAIITASFVAEKVDVGLYDSFETTKMVHHKSKFKKISKELNLSVANSETVEADKIDEKLNISLNFPLIIKPIDLSGGKGISRVNNLQEFKYALKNTLKKTRENTLLIEEFINGSHHSCSLLVKNGQIVMDFFANEYFYLNDYLVEGAYTDSEIDDTVKSKLFSDTEKLIKYLNLVDGLIHIQFILRDKTPYILEVTRRAPGDLYLNLVSYSKNIDFAKLIVKLHTKIAIDKNEFSSNLKNDKLILRHCIMADRVGIIKNLYISEKLQNLIFDKLIWFKVGDEVEDYMSYKAGIVFAKFEGMELLKSYLRNIHNLIKLEF